MQQRDFVVRACVRAGADAVSQARTCHEPAGCLSAVIVSSRLAACPVHSPKARPPPSGCCLHHVAPPNRQAAGERPRPRTSCLRFHQPGSGRPTRRLPGGHCRPKQLAGSIDANTVAPPLACASRKCTRTRTRVRSCTFRMLPSFRSVT